MAPVSSATKATIDRRNAPKQLVDFDKVGKILTKHRLLWIAPTILFGILGTGHALTKRDQWRASQAVLVRDEAIGEIGFGLPGRFDDTDTLKRSLETILQIAKNKQVVARALQQANPNQASKPGWPSDGDVESLQDAIAVAAPKGTEFGMTEVIYVSVTERTPEKAIVLNKALCDQLESRMQELRNQHAESIVAELRQKLRLAETELAAATHNLSQFEERLGSDLGEMRTLAESGGSGESNLRSQLNQIKVELRQAEAGYETQTELLNLLFSVKDDTQALVATPNRLLESQPALRRLKDGLVDAQLRTARLRGAMTEAHPRVQAALQNEENVRSSLKSEIKETIRSIQADLVVGQKLVASLQSKLGEVQGRLDRLAAQRATYVNLVAGITQRRDQVSASRASLAEARARQEAARAASLINRLDEPVTGSAPEGPGRLALMVASTFGGLAIGLSLVYLIAPWQTNRQGAAGRRSTDRAQTRRSPGRRASDRAAEQSTASEGGRRTEDRASPSAPELVCDVANTSSAVQKKASASVESSAEQAALATDDVPEAVGKEHRAIADALTDQAELPQKPNPDGASSTECDAECLTIDLSDSERTLAPGRPAKPEPDAVLASKRLVQSESTLHLNSLPDAVAKVQRHAHEHPEEAAERSSYLEGTFIRDPDDVDDDDQDSGAPPLEHLSRLLDSKPPGQTTPSDKQQHPNLDDPDSTPS